MTKSNNLTANNQTMDWESDMLQKLNSPIALTIDANTDPEEVKRLMREKRIELRNKREKHKNEF